MANAPIPKFASLGGVPGNRDTKAPRPDRTEPIENCVVMKIWWRT
jgi:hypothetical protein